MFSLKSIICKAPIRQARKASWLARPNHAEEGTPMLFKLYREEMEKRFSQQSVHTHDLVSWYKSSFNGVIFVGVSVLGAMYMTINNRFERVDKQFEKVDKRFETLETDVRDIKTMIIEMINKT